MAEETQYTANTGLALISTANSNLDGTGTLGTVLTAASNGTLIKTVYIKAQNDTTQGMVRLFIYDGTNTRLLKEIEIPASDASNIDQKLEIDVDMDFTLKAGYVLKASTENAESFNIIAEGLDWAYYSTSVRTDTTKYTAVTGETKIATASSPAGLITAGLNGCSIESITIKATGNTSDGIITFHIYDGISAFYLFKDIKITAVTKSGIAKSYENTVVFENDLDLKAGYSIYVTTKQSQSFVVTAEGLNWEYPA